MLTLAYMVAEDVVQQQDCGYGAVTVGFSHIYSGRVSHLILLWRSVIHLCLVSVGRIVNHSSGGVEQQ